MVTKIRTIITFFIRMVMASKNNMNNEALRLGVRVSGFKTDGRRIESFRLSGGIARRGIWG